MRRGSSEMGRERGSEEMKGGTDLPSFLQSREQAHEFVGPPDWLVNGTDPDPDPDPHLFVIQFSEKLLYK